MVDNDASSICENNSSNNETTKMWNVEENQTLLNSLSEKNKPEILVSISFENESDELEQPILTIENVSKTYEENSNIEDPNLMIKNEGGSSSVYDEALSEEYNHVSNKMFGDDSTYDTISEKCELNNHLEENDSKLEDISMSNIESNEEDHQEDHQEDPERKSTKDNYKGIHI